MVWNLIRKPFIEGLAAPRRRRRSTLVSIEGANVSPKSIGVEPALSVRDLQKLPCVGGSNTVLGCQAGRFPVVGNEYTGKVTPDNYSDCLCLTEVLGRRLSGSSELVAQNQNVLMLGLVRVERIAEDLCDPSSAASSGRLSDSVHSVATVAHHRPLPFASLLRRSILLMIAKLIRTVLSRNIRTVMVRHRPSVMARSSALTSGISGESTSSELGSIPSIHASVDLLIAPDATRSRWASWSAKGNRR